jgi:hypothetical protein
MNKLWMTFFKLMKIKGFFCHSWRRPWRAGAAGKSHTGKISGDRKPAPAEASGFIQTTKKTRRERRVSENLTVPC